MCKNATDASKFVATQIVLQIVEKQKKGQTCVLGLATGSTPLTLYKELIRIHKEEKISFKNVVTFNLDEYYPISKSSPHSYYTYMHNNLFKHVDIPEANIHIPDGEIDKSHLQEYCRQYESLIESAGGIDIQILGIGRSGHIGFNEPGSSQHSLTRLVYLDKKTREDAADTFSGLENVPQFAITMGIDTILQARRIFLMAFSEGKAKIVAEACESNPTTECPATFL